MRDRIRNEEILLEWRPHTGRHGRSGSKLLEWPPRTGGRSVGRSTTRWTDDLVKIAGIRWMRAAQDRSSWRSLGEAFVQQWIRPSSPTIRGLHDHHCNADQTVGSARIPASSASTDSAVHSMAMDRAILGVSLPDRIRNEEIRDPRTGRCSWTSSG
ncbi:unnamed protein product [Leptidea sinapis]|uniref:Uncharacterized protein n=1 Tax=Leptidea sinapis TaxID=189913 RepID=A0A5E4RA80_9NEOP|nr:unnamed protein product [Leptidea sinapis]